MPTLSAHNYEELNEFSKSGQIDSVTHLHFYNYDLTKLEPQQLKNIINLLKKTINLSSIVLSHCNLNKLSSSDLNNFFDSVKNYIKLTWLDLKGNEFDPIMLAAIVDKLKEQSIFRKMNNLKEGVVPKIYLESSPSKIARTINIIHDLNKNKIFHIELHTNELSKTNVNKNHMDSMENQKAPMQTNYLPISAGENFPALHEPQFNHSSYSKTEAPLYMPIVEQSASSSSRPLNPDTPEFVPERYPQADYNYGMLLAYNLNQTHKFSSDDKQAFNDIFLQNFFLHIQSFNQQLLERQYEKRKNHRRRRQT